MMSQLPVENSTESWEQLEQTANAPRAAYRKKPVGV